MRMIGVHRSAGSESGHRHRRRILKLEIILGDVRRGEFSISFRYGQEIDVCQIYLFAEKATIPGITGRCERAVNGLY